MKPFTFLLLLLRQRIEDRLLLERQKPFPKLSTLAVLRRKRHQIAGRLRRSLAASLPAEG